MGTKAEYEERKRQRREKKADPYQREESDMDLIDILDRMASAFERIADAMEPQIMSSEDNQS